MKMDQASREVKKSLTEWILHKRVFQKIVKLLAQVDTDLFVSRFCHDVPRYVSWHPNPQALMFDVFLSNWKNLQPYVFPPFVLIDRVLASHLEKMRNDTYNTSLTITGVVHTTAETAGSSRTTVDLIFSFSSCEPRRAPISPMSKPDTKPSSVENISQDISAEGLSSKTVALLGSSKRSKTQSHYKACW